MQSSQFLGPIVSTNDLDTWSHLLTRVFGLVQVGRQSLTAEAVKLLWGLEGHSAKTAMFETPATPFGIRILQLNPGSPTSIRAQATGYDYDALKVIDFYVPDFDAARAVLENASYTLKDDVAEYNIDAGRMIEGHLWGPDEVVCALVSGPPNFFRNFVSVTDAVFSEVMSVSAPVTNAGAVIDFYADLGLREVYRYAFSDDSFQRLVGAQESMHIQAVNIGSRREQPYLGLIDYGLPPGHCESLRDVAQLPNRGLVGATIRVSNIEAACSSCRKNAIEILAEPAELVLEPYGSTVSMAVRAPHGVLHHLIQTDNSRGAGTV